MARLIDADALRLMKVEECAGHSIEYAMGWKACIDYVNAAPTIDAIPVEWLKTQLIDDSYDKLIFRWQKEQEGSNK